MKNDSGMIRFEAPLDTPALGRTHSAECDASSSPARRSFAAACSALRLAATISFEGGCPC